MYRYLYTLCDFLLRFPILLKRQIAPRREPMHLIFINIKLTSLLPLKNLLDLLGIFKREILIQGSNMNLQWLDYLLNVFRNLQESRMTRDSSINTRFRSCLKKLYNRPSSPTETHGPNMFVRGVRPNIRNKVLDRREDGMGVIRLEPGSESL